MSDSLGSCPTKSAWRSAGGVVARSLNNYRVLTAPATSNDREISNVRNSIFE